jgi:hypothetical protein
MTVNVALPVRVDRCELGVATPPPPVVALAVPLACAAADASTSPLPSASPR